MIDTRPVILDLFCGAGGAAMGYLQAGFRVIGVDAVDQPNYPGEFHLGDANTWPLDGVDAVHASPPCHDHSSLASRTGLDHGTGWMLQHTLDRLEASGLPYVVENVAGAKMPTTITLCGKDFGLGAGGRVLKRHRKFAANFPLVRPVAKCSHPRGELVGGIYGTGGAGQMTRGFKFSKPDAAAAMEIDWMTWREISQAIPPAYTREIGRQLLCHLAGSAKSIVKEIIMDSDPADALAFAELTDEEADQERVALELEMAQDAAEFQVSPTTGALSPAAVEERARVAEAKLAQAELTDYQAAVAELDAGQRSSLAAGEPVAVVDQAQADRVVDAILAAGNVAVLAGGADVPTTAQAIDPAELEDPARVERVSESLVAIVREPEARVKAGDVVRIHRGVRLYEVVQVEVDLARDATDPESTWEETAMARLVPVDPENEHVPGWTNVDLLHVVPPVARLTTVRIAEAEDLADDPVAVAGTGWRPNLPVLRQVGLVSLPGQDVHAFLTPADQEDARPVGCLRIGDSVVVNGVTWRVVYEETEDWEPRLVRVR